MGEDEKRSGDVENQADEATATPPDSDQMSEAELREALEKQFREADVGDMLVQYLASLSHIGYIKMGLTDDTRDVRDMAQASMAIDGFKALLEAVRDRLDPQDASALEGALASMQMTFAQAGSAGDGAGSEAPSADADEAAADASAEGSDDDDKSSRLWVPGKD